MLIEGVEISHWSGGAYFPAEDTLLLLRHIPEGSGSFLEVGTGTGIVAIHAGKLGYRVVATDSDRASLLDASRNASENRVDIDFVECNLMECVIGMFSVIAFNPPYLPDAGVPDRQLAGGEGGVEVALDFMKQASGRLEEGGRVLLVLSSLGDIDKFTGDCSREWSLKVVDSRKLDFETLVLYEGMLTSRR